MSDQPEEPDGTEEEAAARPLGAWSAPTEESTWVNIEDEPDSSAPGPAGPGASPELPGAPAEVEPATEAGRSRRPTSLRDQYVKSEPEPPKPATMPRRKLEPSAFPSAPAIPGSRAVPGSPVFPAVSEAEQAGSSADVHNAEPVTDSGPAPSFKDKLPLDKLPLDKLSLSKLPLDKLSLSRLPLPKLSRDKLPTDKLPTDKLPVDKVRTFTKQRPEVGLGLAFAGGLAIATILKRLGRK